MSGAAARRGRANPWYAEAFLAIGGWIAGLLAAAAIFALAATIFGGSQEADAPVAVAGAIGIAFVAGASSIGARAAGDFVRHLSISLAAAGLTASVASIGYLATAWLPHLGGDTSSDFTPLRIGLGGLIAFAYLALAGGWSTRRIDDAILTFLTVSAGFWILVIAAAALGADIPQVEPVQQGLPAALALLGLLLFTRNGAGRQSGAAGAALMISAMIFFAAGGLGLGFIGIEGGSSGAANAILFAGGAVYCLARVRDRFPLGALLAATAALSAGIWLLPDAGRVAILILLAGVAAGHRGLAAVGTLALAWFISKYYYDLSASLLVKSGILSGLGASTLLGAFILRKLSGPKNAARSSAAPGRAGSAIATSRLAAAAAFGLVLAGALGLLNSSVASLERDFASARTVLLPLAPVDPRSLIQGDYMTLRFDPRLFPADDSIDALAPRGEVFLKIDAEGVASFSRIAEPTGDPAPDEIRVRYRIVGRSMRYCPESYFFQEGEAELFAPARFAVVLVAADGKTRLKALADEMRTVIDPHADRIRLTEGRGRP